MTVCRRNGLFAALLLGFAMGTPLFADIRRPSSLDPTLSVSVIADPHSGVALFGYDPVAYHVDRKAMVGKSSITAVYRDAVFQFRSSANRSAFLAAPDHFLPEFGGYDAQSVSEGRMTVGDPESFVLHGEKLVLFRNDENRDRFASDGSVRQAASDRWPDVVRQHGFH